MQMDETGIKIRFPTKNRLPAQIFKLIVTSMLFVNKKDRVLFEGEIDCIVTRMDIIYNRMIEKVKKAVSKTVEISSVLFLTFCTDSISRNSTYAIPFERRPCLSPISLTS